MSARAVLKAGQTANVPTARVMLRNAVVAPDLTPAEPGIWISQSELDALKNRWMDQGRVEGEEFGRQQAQQSAREQAERDAKAHLDAELKERQDKQRSEQAEKWRGLAAALAGQFHALRVQLEDELTEWTFMAVTRLLGQQRPEHVALAVRQVLEDAKLDGPMTVLLHPHDLAGVQAGNGGTTGSWPEGLSFAAAERVSLGGCLIECEAQTLDARLEVQLALLRETLDAARRERTGMGN